jgi:hypothetical protein
MKPILQFIEDPATPDVVRRFLQWAVHGAANDEAPPPLFANWRSCRVRVVTAKHTGFVGVTADLGSLAPRHQVSLTELSAFLEVAYPKQKRARCRVASPREQSRLRFDEVVAACARRAGIGVDAFRRRERMKERCFVVGQLHLCRASDSAIGRAIGVQPTAVKRCLDKIGLRGPDTMERRWLRIIWESGPRQVGDGPQQVPRAVANALAFRGYAIIEGGFCKAALPRLFPDRNEMRAAA